MDNFTIIISIASFTLILLLVTFIIIFEKIRKQFIKEDEKLLILKDCYEKVSEEAIRSLIIERVEKKGNELIDQFNNLNIKLVKIKERQVQLQEQQKNLHNNLLEQHKLLNEYFENYS
ncbi:hypothetical protein [Chryseobacterium shigense]|uniref:Membrane-bound ClpP family serine protease n=1 Tax=Chryseobacterium shigense TaxID=297244 RepID=A0A841N0U4_9FLAO|nr:hypothetical protein [Chryseobacterium shigense]MBB6370037.1 membrane-bound ClpP family serine protease [Chryseobacterium shigense]